MKHLILVIFALILCACNKNKQQNLLQQKWDESSYYSNLEILLNLEIINCKTYLNYLSYPASADEFKNLMLKEAFTKINSKSSKITIDSTFNYENKKAEIKNVNINKQTNEIEILVSLNNKNDFAKNLNEIQIDIWLSKFWLIGTYTYNTFEKPLLKPESATANTLYLPLSNLEETLIELGYNNRFIPFECLIYKIKNLRVE